MNRFSSRVVHPPDSGVPVAGAMLGSRTRHALASSIPIQTTEMIHRTINVNRQIRRRILDNLPRLLDNPRHPDLVDLVRLDDPESDVFVDLIVLGTLRSDSQVSTGWLHASSRLTKSFVRSPPCTLVPLLMHPSRLACQKNVPWVMADWFDAIPVYPSYGSQL